MAIITLFMLGLLLLQLASHSFTLASILLWKSLAFEFVLICLFGCSPLVNTYIWTMPLSLQRINIIICNSSERWAEIIISVSWVRKLRLSEDKELPKY